MPRRRFLTVGSLGLVGLWTGFSDQVCARTVREFVAETGRGVLQPEFTPRPDFWDENSITAAWLGHSSVLINFYGVHILTDPVLGKRIGADTVLGTVGPKRLVAPALHASELPDIDLVVLSHAHMDHLDPATLRMLSGRPKAVTARNTADLLPAKMKQVTTLGWGERSLVRTRRGDLEIGAFEVKHWGARWKYDTHRGYNGYVISRGERKILFGGDTAWSNSFRSLRRQGPFEFAIMPIGAYNPWICSHCTPEEAVRMADTAGAAYFLPVHFKTFRFGREGVVEPMHRLVAAIERDRIGWREVGATFKLC